MPQVRRRLRTDARIEARFREIEERCIRLAKDAEIQFKRIAEMQAELDELRAGAENMAELTARIRRRT
jgi:hypothetical protein